ncbi:hypothetical protein ACF0H5_024004 [Mactra antiquata]
MSSIFSEPNPSQVFTQESEPEKFSKSDTKSINSNFTNLQAIRINLVKQACRNVSFLEENIYAGKRTSHFYFSKQYNFALCKVPKCGSTFWTQTFGVLTKGTQRAENVFTMKRTKVHGTSRSFFTGLSKIKNSPTVLVSRDPYSRLYSAYVDKVFLMLQPTLSCAVRTALNKKTESTVRGKCPTDVTFEEFLKFVVKTVLAGKSLNIHYAPIESFCQPCKVKAMYLLKQESFATDAVEILKDIGVEKKKLNVINSALHEHRIEYTIPGIVKTAYGRLLGGKNRMTGLLLAQKLWKSFQIQGYIPDSIDLPSSSENAYTKVDYFIHVVMETIEKHKLSSDESKTLRQKHLVNAYKGIEKDIIERIRQIYEVDIALFGYDVYPPVSY